MQLKRSLRAVSCALTAVQCLAGVLTDAASAQPPMDRFGKWAIARAIPLRTLEPDGEVSDLSPLKTVVGAARIVALGESTHGAHEPLAFRNRLVRFLVEQMGFTAIALETGFIESRAIERFVAGGPGELRGVVRDGMSWGFGRFPENEELIDWVRTYNVNPMHHRKVRFYGVDLSGAKNGAFSDARRAIDYPLKFLAQASSADAERVQQTLRPCLEKFSTAGYSGLTPSQRESLASGLFV